MNGYATIKPGHYVAKADVFVGWRKGDTAEVLSAKDRIVTYRRSEHDPWEKMSTSLFRAMFRKADVGGAP